MAQTQETGKAYVCPMHPEVRQARGGKCPKCGMALVPESTRFGLLQYMIANPLMLAIIAAVMATVIWIVFR